MKPTQLFRASRISNSSDVAWTPVIAAAFAWLVSPANAVPYIWDAGGGGTNTWANATNWNPDGVPTFVAGDTFDLSTLNIAATSTSTVSAATTLGNILIGDTNNTNNWTLAGGGFLNYDNGASAVTITQVAGSASNTISGAYTVASDLTLTNNSATNGTLAISGLGTVNKSNLTLTQNGSSATGVVNLSGGLGFNSASGTTFTTSGTTAAITQINSLAFAAGTSAMTTSGGAFTLLGGAAANASGFVQTIDQNITLNSAAHNFSATGGFGFTLNGAITTGAGVNGDLTFSGAGTSNLGGTNSLIFTNASGRVNVTNNAILEISGATAISGTGASGGTFVVGSNAASTNTLNVNTGGSLTVNGTSNATQGGVIVGQQSVGILNVSGTLTVNRGGFYVGNTATNAGSGSQMNIGTGASATFVTVGTADEAYILLGRQSGTGTVNLNGGTLATSRTFGRNGGNSTNAGTANFNFNGGTLQATGSNSDWLNTTTRIDVIGTNDVFALSAVTTGATSGNISTIDANGFGVGINNAISGLGGFKIVNTGGASTGIVTFGGANTYSGLTTISSGSLALSATGSIAGSSGVALNSGNFNVSAVTSGYTLGSTQSLTGSGTVTGNLSISGNLAVGNSAGTIDFGGNLGLNPGSVSDFQFTSASFTLGSFDRANGTGTASFGGTLNLLFNNLTTYADNSTVQIFNFTTGYSGAFSTINFTGLGAGQSATFDATSGFVTVVPEPAAAILGGISLLFLLTRHRKAV